MSTVNDIISQTHTHTSPLWTTKTKTTQSIENTHVFLQQRTHTSAEQATCRKGVSSQTLNTSPLSFSSSTSISDNQQLPVQPSPSSVNSASILHDIARTLLLSTGHQAAQRRGRVSPACLLESKAIQIHSEGAMCMDCPADNSTQPENLWAHRQPTKHKQIQVKYNCHCATILI